MSSVVKPKQFKVKATLDIVPQKTNFVDVIDTGTTTHLFLKESNVEKIRKVDVGINVMSPNRGVTQSIATAKVKLPHVSKTAGDAHIFSSLDSGSVYSVGQLCDDDCEAYFNKSICTITKKGKLVLSGTRTANSQIWIANDTKYPNALYNDAATVNTFSQTDEPQTTINSSLAHEPSHAANALCPEPHLATRIVFFHTTLFLPAISTLCSAIDAGLLHSLPGNITSSQVRKHLCFS